MNKTQTFFLAIIILLCSLGATAQNTNRQRGDRQRGNGKKEMKQKRQKSMTDSIFMLEEVVATGVARKMVVKEDTFEYNASAYKTPEGSTLEELVKRLPGAQIDENGKITINGKEVKKIMIDGKEFMTGDTETALKNLPTSIIERVKSYDERSDMARMTGVDDGEETTVLDFGIKKGMNKGVLSNIDLAIGTKSRYAERIMGAYMKDKSRLMLFMNMNNTGDRGFTSGGRRGGMGNSNGLQANKMIGLNYNYEKKNKLKADLSVRWNHSDNDIQTTASSENFVSNTGSFTNSRNVNYSRSDQWNMRARIEWNPDSLTTILFRPAFSTRKGDSRNMSSSATFNKDPYSIDGVSDPLDSISMRAINNAIYAASMGKDSLLINRRDNSGLNETHNTSFNAQLTVSRKLSATGRNITFQGRYSVGNTDDDALSTQRVLLYRPSTADSLYYKNRYNITPGKTWSYRLAATYSEPIAKQTFIQLKYQYEYKYSKSERSTYDFSDPNKYPGFGYGIVPQYRDFDAYLSPYVNDQHPLSEALDIEQSRHIEYRNYIHDVELTLRKVHKKYRLNVGVLLQPQISNLTYRYLNIDTIASRQVVNACPTLDLRYTFNKQKFLRIRYRGSSEQPSMTDLMPITDNTDPLKITKGNPNLKPSFVNSFRVYYSNYVQRHMRSIMAYLNLNFTRNSVANKVTYNTSTGGSITQPENIDGKWDVRTALMLNTALDSIGNWNMNTFTTVSYSNNPGYVNLTKYDEATKSHTRTAVFNERLGFSYRKSWFEVELNGEVTYTTSRNNIQEQSKLDTWMFSYGTDLTFNFPWNMSISTGAHVESRRGYSDSAMNDNEMVWNAQVAQSMLKGKNLTISLQLFDILHQRSSLTRSLTATQRVDTNYNNINSYCMLHAIYRFNAFGGKEAMKGFGDNPHGGNNFGGTRGGGGFGGGNFGGGGRNNRW